VSDITEKLKILASTDIFKSGRDSETFCRTTLLSGLRARQGARERQMKHRVGGIPAVALLLCSYDSEVGVEEMVLVRVIGPTALPTDSDVVASMVDHYKEDQPPGTGTPKKLDSFTRTNTCSPVSM